MKENKDTESALGEGDQYFKEIDNLLVETFKSAARAKATLASGNIPKINTPLQAIGLNLKIASILPIFPFGVPELFYIRKDPFLTQVEKVPRRRLFYHLH